MLRNKKKNKGFTLVEVIVVAVIVGVLAAVAIPLYLNYVNDSRLQSATNVAGAAAVFCASCLNSGGTPCEGDTSTVIATGDVTGPKNLVCKGNASSIAIPEKIVLTLTVDGTGHGTIKGHHVDNAAGVSKDYPF